MLQEKMGWPPALMQPSRLWRADHTKPEKPRLAGVSVQSWPVMKLGWQSRRLWPGAALMFEASLLRTPTIRYLWLKSATCAFRLSKLDALPGMRAVLRAATLARGYARAP